MDVKELKRRIETKSTQMIFEELKRNEDAKKLKYATINKIKSYAPQLKELFEVANYCLAKNIPLDANKPHATTLFDGERERYFITDPWFHYLGFYIKSSPLGKEIVGIRYAAGGACGETNFKVLEDGEISVMEKNFGYVENYANKFISEIDEFISRFERYINSL